jgi:hypothetical protein
MGKICGKISSLRIKKRWRKIPLGFFLLVNSVEKNISKMTKSWKKV